MKLVPVTRDHHAQIDGWRYPEPYGFYDMDRFPEDIVDRHRPAFYERAWRATVSDNGELLGFWELTRDGDTLTIGLGMRPDLTGQGEGQRFVEHGLDVIAAAERPSRLRLEVSDVNIRARKVYERVGFRGTGQRRTLHPGGERVVFVEMVKPLAWWPEPR